MRKPQNALTSDPVIPSSILSTPVTSFDPFWKTLLKLKKNSVPVLKGVPHYGARLLVAQHLARCVCRTTRENSQSAWEHFHFPLPILATKKTLTAQIKVNCNIAALNLESK